MSAPALIPSGLYRIIVAEPTALVSDGGIQEPKCLTDEGGSVTLSPPSAGNARKQQVGPFFEEFDFLLTQPFKWTIRSGKDGNIIIHRPSELSFPLPYLTYEGTSEIPEPGDRIVVRGLDLPPNEWHAEIKSECFYLSVQSAIFNLATF
jgi:hypothetical protein